VHVHHAVVDGYHVGLFIDKFQEGMNGGGNII
jgi:chloramphenicol O-acetyltransferase